jgi:hypothetical protein
MRRLVLLSALCAGLFSGTTGWAAAARQAPAPPPPGADDYRFLGARGLLVFHVHRERTQDFEEVMRQIRGGLDASDHPVRRAQAQGWRLFRSADTSAGAVYVVMVDSVVPDSDYDPVKMLTEFVPSDLPAAYDRLRGAVSRVERLDLTALP